MPALSVELRKQLENAVPKVRDYAESAAAVVLDTLAVNRAEPHAGLSADQRRLRNALRARGRALGDGLLADGLFSSFTEARAYPVTQYGKLQGGDIRYKDIDADKKITGSDRVVLGNPIPRYTYSLDLYTSYKGFDFTVFFQGVGKRDSYDSGWDAYPFQNASTALVQHLNRWSEANPNPKAATPRLSINQQSNNLQPSSFWIINASYLRLKNIQLGYTLPVHLVKKAGIAGVRFFANGNNVFTASKMPVGMDPESPESTNNYVPMLATYTFGVEVKF